MKKILNQETMLTPKQIRFIDEYLIDLNAKQAAIRAGYSPRSAEFQGSKLLSDSKVSQEITNRQAIIAKQFQVTREDLIKDLVYIKDKNKDAFPPAAINAIKEIGKFLGLYEADKQDITIKSEQPLFGPDKSNE
jgi:phage terminase small subunit